MKIAPVRSVASALQIRVKLGATKAFGPGKAELLERIAASGSISAAAREMRMSYKRAWQLVDDMNGAFRTPLVRSATGGRHGGGAGLTATGRSVLASYRAIQESLGAAARPKLERLIRLARKNGAISR